MKFMVYATRAGADNRSRSEAQRRKCGPVTTHWWDVIPGTDGNFALGIPDKPDEETNMTAADRSRLVATFSRKPLEETT